jgi:hypothetical protein
MKEEYGRSSNIGSQIEIRISMKPDNIDKLIRRAEKIIKLVRTPICYVVSIWFLALVVMQIPKILS